MRDSYFAREVDIVLTAVKYSDDQSDLPTSEILSLVSNKLEQLLGDELMPEREWRQQVARPLDSLARLLRYRGKPVRRLEDLAHELAI